MMASLDTLRRFLDEKIAQMGISGIDFVAYRDHRQVFRHAAGYQDMEAKRPMQPDALINLYSATKVITCVAALQLLEQGKFLLSYPVHMYLPEFQNMLVRNNSFMTVPARNPIRIADLFCMTAGINYNPETPEKLKLYAQTNRKFSTRDFAKTIATEPLQFEPGEGWDYSYCHDVLAALVEEVAGMRFGEYLDKNVFEPLGMADTGFRVPEEKKPRLAPQYQYDAANKTVKRITSDCLGALGEGHESGGGGLISTANDYILFADALACGGIGKSGGRILSEASVRLLSQNRLLPGRQTEQFRKMVLPAGVGYGLGVGCFVNPVETGILAPEGSFYWGGIGGVQNLFDPKNRLSFFMAQNCFFSPKELIAHQMINILYAGLS